MTGFEEFASADDRRAVVEANRALAAAGQSDMVWGHAGLRVTAGSVLMKVSGLGFEEVGDGDLISTPQLGEELANCLGGNNGCLIPGHGMVTVGRSLASAVMHTALLDRACRVQLEAMAAGGPRRWSTEAEVARKRAGLWTEGQLRAGYDYLVRRGNALAEPGGYPCRQGTLSGFPGAGPRS